MRRRYAAYYHLEMTENLQTRIEQLVAKAEALIPSIPIPDLLPSELSSGQPDWHRFEHSVWRIGEDIRQLILTKKSLRKDASLQAAFVRICTNRNSKRGRQSFIMLLGYKCCQKHAPEIASQLNDSFVVGHVIDTLLKMHAKDFVQEIRPFVDHQVAWIRNKAKAYCKRYGGVAYRDRDAHH
jgi:hypothetical protein